MDTSPAAIDDAELERLALAADVDEPLPADAVSLWDLDDPVEECLLPGWYMPVPMPGGRRLTGWKRRVAIAVIAAFVLIDAAGLCSTYGSIVPA
jgi:hypothetical protein